MVGYVDQARRQGGWQGGGGPYGFGFFFSSLFLLVSSVTYNYGADDNTPTSLW